MIFIASNPETGLADFVYPKDLPIFLKNHPDYHIFRMDIERPEQLDMVEINIKRKNKKNNE